MQNACATLQAASLCYEQCLQSRRARRSYSHMSGITFDTPATRFLRRSSLFEKAMLSVASLVDHWLTCAGRLSKRYRHNEAKFPAAQTAYELRVLRGSRAADRVSFDALRPNENWVNLEDQYEISFIREKLAAFARRFPTKERRSLALSKCDPENASEKNALAENHCAFHKRKNETFCRSGAEWCAATAASA
jgi:hypothetical protein